MNKENAIPFTRYSRYGKKMPISFYVIPNMERKRRFLSTSLSTINTIALPSV